MLHSYIYVYYLVGGIQRGIKFHSLWVASVVSLPHTCKHYFMKSAFFCMLYIGSRSVYEAPALWLLPTAHLHISICLLAVILMLTIPMDLSGEDPTIAAMEAVFMKDTQYLLPILRIPWWICSAINSMPTFSE